MIYSFYALLSRMKHIKRWGLKRNTQDENLSEHSFMTAVLAHALAVIRRDIYGKKCDPYYCATAALYHDSSEILTGDMPTPVKYFSPKIRESYREAESAAAERLIGMLPSEMQREFSPLVRESLPPDVLEIVKVADKLAAYIKCAEELRAGNGEFRKAAEVTKMALEVYDLPELTYFCDHFLPAFELTLDELE